MAVKAEQAQARVSGVSVKPALEVLLLYEDLGTALRAKYSLDRMLLQLGAEVKMSTRLWRLDLLSQPLLAEQAAIEASAADLIVLSLHSHRQLRAEVRDWLSRWLDHKSDRPCALAALLDVEPTQAGSRNPVLAYLRRVAETAGADLFCGSCQVPRRR
jgi:hypothetical protein